MLGLCEASYVAVHQEDTSQGPLYEDFKNGYLLFYQMPHLTYQDDTKCEVFLS